MRRTIQILIPLAIFALTAPAFAQRVVFLPRLSAGASYSSNLEFSSEEQRDDVAATFGVALPVVWNLERGRLSLVGQGRYFEQSREGALSRTEYSGNIGYGFQPNEKTNLSFNAGYSVRQSQTGSFLFDEEDPDEVEPFLTRRVETESINAGFNFSQVITRLWSWNSSLRYSRLFNDDIDGFTAESTDDPLNDDALNDVEDREAFTWTGGTARLVSKRTSVGIRLTARRFDLDRNGVQRTYSGAFTTNTQIGEGETFGFAVGGFYSEGDTVEGNATSEGVTASLNYGKTLRRTRFRANATVSPSSGGNLVGTATRTSIGIGLNDIDGRNWNWGVTTRYTRRDPTDDAGVLREAYTARANASRRLLRQLSFSMGISYNRQEVDLDTVDAFDFFGANAGLVWSPNANRRG